MQELLDAMIISNGRGGIIRETSKIWRYSV